MLNFFKSKTEKAPKAKIKIIQAQPKPGQSMDDFVTEMKAAHGLDGDAAQGNMSDLFKHLGQDAAQVLKDSGVDIDELIAAGVISPKDIPS